MQSFPLKVSPYRQPKYRQGQIKATQALYCHAMTYLLDNGLVDSVGAAILSGWLVRMSQCAATVWLKACSDNHARAVVECCQVPMCPRCQRKRANHWVARAQALLTGTRVDGKKPRMVTVGLRHPDGESLLVAARKVIKLRAALMRKLRREYGMTAAFAAIEMSDNGHVHLHCLVWSDYTPRTLLQTWLRGRDCTVPGCSHPADDRCDSCRASKIGCAHHYGQRQRCNGSYMVDIRKCSSPVEAMKYSVKPIVSATDHAEAPTPEQLAQAIRTVMFYLGLYKRHRIETYGEAKRIVEGEGDADEDRDADICHCGLPLHLACVGRAGSKGYFWRPARPGEQIIFSWQRKRERHALAFPGSREARGSPLFVGADPPF